MTKALKSARANRLRGVAIACGVISAWLLVQALGLFVVPFPAALALAPLATFLYVGLFITGHDALHGTVAPGRPRLNRTIGRVAVALYAAFDTRALEKAHAQHHAQPAREGDPDYRSGEGYLRWLGAFFWKYVTIRQLILLALAGNVLTRLCGVPPSNLIAVWIAPALASAIQLFTFGTFLPHRQPEGGHRDEHRARSLELSPLWSFLSCWHFGGRHHEHHANPAVPWWSLNRSPVDVNP